VYVRFLSNITIIIYLKHQGKGERGTKPQLCQAAWAATPDSNCGTWA